MSHPSPRPLFTAFALVLCTASLASADDFSKAVHAEFVSGKLKQARKLYARVKKGPRKEQAAYRRLLVLAKLGKDRELKRGVKAFKRGFPQSGLLKYAIPQLEKNPEKWALPGEVANRAVLKLLDARKVSLNFGGTPLPEVGSFLTDISGLNVVVAASARKATVNVKLANVSLKDALDVMSKMVNAPWTAQDGALLIGLQPQVLRIQKVTQKALAAQVDTYLKLKDSQITLNFDGTPLSEALQFFKDISGINVTLGKGIQAQSPVSARLKRMTLEQVLGIVAEQAGAKVVLDASGLRLEPIKTP